MRGEKIISMVMDDVFSSVRFMPSGPQTARLHPAPAVINLIKPSSLENYAQYFFKDTKRHCNSGKPAALLRSSTS